MASVTPFGAIPQSQGLIEGIEKRVRAEEEKQSNEKDSKFIESSLSENKELHTFDTPAGQRRIVELARTFTQQSIKTESGSYINPFKGSTDPALDPKSGKFNARQWVKNIIGISSRDPERYPKRVAGISFKNLNVHGFGNPTDYQKTFGNYPLEIPALFNKIRGKGQTKIQILRDFEGLVKSGEMLVVLGRPGSGCTTLLKTISGETKGFFVDAASQVNYQGIPMETMHRDFRGECMYQAEVDVHFPQLTVGQTLMFAAEARAPQNRFPGVSRKEYAAHMRDVVMAVFGLSHTFNTKVGNDYIRGVSGGERKRVSIAEAALGGSPLQCWDNSTRGLDSATALEFVKTLRISTQLGGSTAIVAIYQASQNIYDEFDKVALLYQGFLIYFGDKVKAKGFFLAMGFECPERQTTGDFLTSLTSPAERRVRPGFEDRTPRTPDEFAARWRDSEDRAQLLREIEEFERDFPVGGPHLETFRTSRKAQQADHQRVKSPYTISIPMQINLCMRRGFQRLSGDLTLFLTQLIGNSIMALIVGSVFYNLPNNTGSLYSFGALIFFAALLNAFSSALEILTLYAQRPIVEKQAKYAFYHPFSEAVASMICDLPNKLLTAIFFNIVLYFMTNLRRTASAFFIFVLFSFVAVLNMSMFFRSIASMSRSLPQAMAPAALFMLALIIYTGFTIPIANMHPWFRWINYLDPVAYAFEALMINQFHGLDIPCSQFIPPYPNASLDEKICAAIGSTPGASVVDGTTYLKVNFSYDPAHLWRNLGILIALTFFGMAVHLLTTEYISAARSKGEVLLFPRGRVPRLTKAKNDEESGHGEMVHAQKTTSEIPPHIQKQTAIFHWDSVNYEIQIKKETRMLLNDVDGWVKPGTLTALMGASGAGKTTLLDVLASRTTMGVVTGEMLVNGNPRDSGFQRKTGYVQQQDLHLATSTVREAITFSALLRQPKTTPRAEKKAYVDEVLKVLEMESYADAVVGVPGEGLNVEQRKRLTIAVELAAKPALLLFLDEPTSGLDSQTAWSICALLRKLANNGQAILCTIHQPSAILFQEFDNLLFLAAGGRTVYFGDIGEKSTTLTNYFERNGSRLCGPEENPAEWMLDVIGAAPGSQNTLDWSGIWRDSPERQVVKRALLNMKTELSQKPMDSDPTALNEFAVAFPEQLRAVTVRIFQQYWRTPSYLYSKTLLCTSTGLFLGFSFWDTPTSLQGLQNQLFAVFMLLTIFSSLVQQIMPHFVTQRSLYEVRERPSKTYSWVVFMVSNIMVELPWNSLMAVILYFTWYYPIGLYKNATPTGASHERGALLCLLIWQFLLFASTFTHMVIAGIEAAETAGNLANLCFSLILIFCGVLAGPTQLPRFWIFMYRVSPFTYLVSSMLSVGLANTDVVCSATELLKFNAPPGLNCGQYMDPYIKAAGGKLQNSTVAACEFCPIRDTNTFLKTINSFYGQRWRNFGLLWVYIIFNVCGAIFLYWLVRVPKKWKGKKAKKE